MRILTNKEFAKEPYGIVYVEFIPMMFAGNPKIKTEPRGTESWWATDVLPWVIDEEEIREYKKNNHYELQTEGFCTDDAIYNYNDDRLFAVFDKTEVKGMIDRLVKSLYESEKYNK
jgi:hypothetical protein